MSSKKKRKEMKKKPRSLKYFETVNLFYSFFVLRFILNSILFLLLNIELEDLMNEPVPYTKETKKR